MINLLKLKPCEECEGLGMQVQTEGPLRGMVRMCPNCGSSYKKWVNQYGNDYKHERQGVYVDMSGSRPILTKSK